MRIARESPETYGAAMNGTAPANSSTAIWERAIRPSRRSLDRAAARALLDLKLSARDLHRADTLTGKACAGTLTGEEAAELESYRSVGTALEFLKAKARLALKTARN